MTERQVDDDLSPEDVEESGKRSEPAPRKLFYLNDLAPRGQAAMSEGRMPPCNIEAEAAVLSAVMTDGQLLARIPALRPEHFFSEANRRIFECCLALAGSGSPIDTVQVSTWLRDHDRLAQVGGIPYLMEVQQAAPIIANISSYADAVHAKWRARQAILCAQLLTAKAYAGIESDTIIVEVTRELEKLAPPIGAADFLDGAAIAEPVSDPEFLVSELGLVAGSGAPHLFAGYGFSGKTVAIQSAAISLAAGKPLWGSLRVRRPMRVAHVDLEQGDQLTRRRYQRLAWAMGVDLRDLGDRIALKSFPKDLVLKPSYEPKWRAIMQGRDLMFLDSLKAATAGADENSSDIREGLDMLGYVSETTGCRALCVHHARKPTEDSAGGRYSIRGSGAIYDALDGAYIFSGERGEPVTVTHEKARTTGSLIESFALVIEDVPEEGGSPYAGLSVQVRGIELVKERREEQKRVRDAISSRKDVTVLRETLGKHPGINATTLRAATGFNGERFRLAILAIGDGIQAVKEKTATGQEVRYYLRSSPKPGGMV